MLNNACTGFRKKTEGSFMKKIVVLTGSPRKDGNSFAMTDAFVRAAEAKGHKVTRFDTAFMQVGGCHACETCFSTGQACAYHDDFNTIAPAILEADVVMLTTPVYWYTVSAQLKAVMDKFYSLLKGADATGKQCMLIACAQEDDAHIFDGTVFAVERSAEHLGWKMTGTVLVGGVDAPGDVTRTDGCARAAALADLL